MALETLLANEATIRLASFCGVLAVMAVWEIAAPRRPLGVSRWLRWPNNLGIVALNALLVRLVSPTAAVGVAMLAEREGWGLLNAAQSSAWLAVPIAVLLLDFAIYFQHVLFHAAPILWRLHRMHHADPDFDVTTGARFHPFEILLSLGIKAAIVIALGAPAAAVLIFEVLLNATAMFNHGNVRIPLGFDRALRCVVVTPDMHRVHHSVTPGEANSNFGFSLPWWDRLFGTYRAQPEEGHAGMTIGIGQFNAPRDLWLDRLLIQPWLGEVGDYPIGRRKG